MTSVLKSWERPARQARHCSPRPATMSSASCPTCRARTRASTLSATSTRTRALRCVPSTHAAPTTPTTRGRGLASSRRFASIASLTPTMCRASKSSARTRRRSRRRRASRRRRMPRRMAVLRHRRRQKARPQASGPTLESSALIQRYWRCPALRVPPHAKASAPALPPAQRTPCTPPLPPAPSSLPATSVSCPSMLSAESLRRLAPHQQRPRSMSSEVLPVAITPFASSTTRLRLHAKVHAPWTRCAAPSHST
mmetsp:Transcript_43809/g.111953  ORF Transcript_43809/g.111953 Transcript_43809/m.111953 type:complete len:253 (-) Transcript_43809:251-1009(-)